MSDLYRIGVHQRNMDGDIDTERDIAALVEAGVLVKVEPLLTREEAAADPEVRQMVRDSIAAKWPLGVNARWVTDDE